MEIDWFAIFLKIFWDERIFSLVVHVNFFWNSVFLDRADHHYCKGHIVIRSDQSQSSIGVYHVSVEEKH